jgi:uncharacterized repeat protein (TIGR01451 family)
LVLGALAIASVLALGVGGATATTEAAALSLDVNSGSITLGSSVTLNGVLTEAGDGDLLFGGSITVTRYTGTGCSTGATTAGSTTTGSNGGYSVDDSPGAPGQYSYKAFYTGGAHEQSGSSTFAPTSSGCKSVAVTATVGTSLGEGVAPAVVATSGSTTISGALTRNDSSAGVSGAGVTVTRYTDSGCSAGATAVGSPTTNGSGAYSIGDTPSAAPGSFWYQASYAGTSDGFTTLQSSSSSCQALRVNAPPTASAGGPYTGTEGSPVSVTASASTDEAGIASYAWTYSVTSAPNGATCSFADATAVSTTFTCTDQGTFGAKVAVTDTDGATTSASATVTLMNVAPSATLANSGPVGPNVAAVVSFSAPSDPSANDTTAGFHYAFDRTGGTLAGATYANSGTATSNGCSFSQVGTHNVSGAIIDKDNGKTTLSTAVVVNPVVQETADLAMSVEAEPTNVSPGDHLAFTATITNNGPNTAHDVTVNDTVPDGVTFVRAGASQGVGCAGSGPVTCSLGDIPGKGSASITVVVVANDEGTLTDGASVSSSTTDPVPQNNSSNGSATSSQAPPPADQLSGVQVQGDVTVNGQPFTGGTIAYGSLIDVKIGSQITFSSDVGKIVVFPPDGVETSFIVVRTTSSFRLPSGRLSTGPTIQFTLTGGGLSTCGTKALGDGAAKKKPPSRSLWANGHGHYRTKGKYSSATVSGTYWYTRDTCDGTLTKVKRGRVQVRDFVKNKTVFVTAGHEYFAAAHPTKKTAPKKPAAHVKKTTKKGKKH